MAEDDRPDRPKLILHVGTQKTGTTTIQGFLKNATNALQDAGVHYLNTGRTNIAHNVMIPMIRKGRGPNLARRLIKEMGRHSDKTSVISSEMFFRTDMADFFATHFPPELLAATRVVVYLRRQDKYAEAMWKQRVKNGRYTGSPQAYVAAHKSLDFLPILNHFTGVFGLQNMIVRPFERAHFPKGDVLQDFASHCQIPPELAASYDVPSSNATLSKEVSEELGRMNREKSGINTRQVIRTLSRLRPEGAIRSGDCFTLTERQDLMQRFATQNEALRAKYCPELPHLFDLSDLDDPENYPVASGSVLNQREQQAQSAIQLALTELGH